MKKIISLLKSQRFHFLGAGLLIVGGVLGRIYLLDYPNVETLTVTALLAGALLGGGYAIVVPLLMVSISDMYIGNDPIMIFTWSAWAMIGGLGWLLRRHKRNFWLGVKLTGFGLAAGVVFYLWTNLGVWLMFNMYPQNWEGLLTCYIMAIPFFKANIISNLIIVPAVSLPLIFLLKYGRIILARLKEKFARTEARG